MKASIKQLGSIVGRLLAVTVIAVSLTGCLKSNTNTTTTPDQTSTTTDSTTTPTSTVTDLTTLTPTSFDADLSANLAAATAQAKSFKLWHPDTVLSYVSVSLGTSLEPKKGSEVYVFGSASDLENWFTYSISQETGKTVRAIIPKADYLNNQNAPINLKFWKMNYVQALQLAEQNGGSAFRTTNPNPQITVFLSTRSPRNYLWWTVEYKSTTGQTLSLLINPYLGGVVDEQGNQLVPDQTSPATTTPSTTTQ